MGIRVQPYLYHIMLSHNVKHFIDNRRKSLLYKNLERVGAPPKRKSLQDKNLRQAELVAAIGIVQ